MSSVAPQGRLQPIEPEYNSQPWVEAQNLDSCFLFWLPVSAFPLRYEERAWILEFLTRFSAVLARVYQLREEVFLQFATATATFEKPFRQYSRKSFHLPGLSRKPGEQLRGIPDPDVVAAEIKETRKFDLEKWTSDYVLWFQKKDAEEQRTLFLGAGGMTLLFLPPDPRTKPPTLPFTPKLRAAFPVFQRVDVDGMLASAFTLQDGFLQKSKELFGQGLPQESHLESIGFVLPQFDSGHLLYAQEDERTRWFTLFDVYLRESVADRGLVLAFVKDYRPLLREVLQSLEEDNLVYPMGPTTYSSREQHG